ncbi:MAG: winged helix-turn-helix domain-containing protein [Acidobacteriota bacterium]|nr:winged helix-turn-helix domain-containing protein [Acidobacteriota bacterium]
MGQQFSEPSQRLDSVERPVHRLRFGDFVVDLEMRRLLREGRPLAVQEKPLLLLETLLRQPGRVVSRAELRRALWPDAEFLDFENNINVAVGKLREVLGESAAEPRWIHTVPRRGYRFVGSVEAVAAEDPGSAVAQPASGARRLVYGGLVGLATLGVLAILWLGSSDRSADLRDAGSAEAPRSAAGLPAAEVVRLRLAPVEADGPELEASAQRLAAQLANRLPVLRPEQLVVTTGEGAEGSAGADYELRSRLTAPATALGSRARPLLSAELVNLSTGEVEWSFARPPEPHETLVRGILRRLPFVLLPPGESSLAVARDAAFEPMILPPPSERLRRLEERWATASMTPREKAELALLLLDERGAAGATEPGAPGLGAPGLGAPGSGAPGSRALALARNALAAAPDSPDLLAAAAQVELFVLRDYGRSRQLAARALRLEPGHKLALETLASIIVVGNPTSEGRSLREVAGSEDRVRPNGAAVLTLRQLGGLIASRAGSPPEPLTPEQSLRVGRLWLLAGLPHEAQEACKAARREESQAPDVWYCLELAHALLGNEELEMVAAALSLSPGASKILEQREPVEGETETEALRYLRLLRLSSSQHGTPFGPAYPWRLAYDAAELGEPELALAWLERGLSEGLPQMLFVGVDPAFRKLHGDPRFAELVARAEAPRPQVPPQ